MRVRFRMSSAGARLTSGWAVLVLLSPGLGPPASAQALPDFAGVWHNVAMSTPSRIRYETDLQGRITWIHGLDDFETWSATITVDADGQFSGPVSGSITVAGPGLLRVSVPDEPNAEFVVNSRGDFLMSVKLSPNREQQDLELLLKAPVDLAVADLAGAWRGFNLVTPARIEPIYQENLVVGLEPRGRFLVRMGSLNVAADGTVSGDMGGPFTGHAALGADGTVWVHIDEPPPDPGFDLRFAVNAGKDILAAQTRDEEGGQEIILFLRTPDSLSGETLKGLWRAADFAVPNQVTLLTNAVGEAFGIQEAGDFEIWREATSVGHSGGVIGLTEPLVGQITLETAGRVRLTGTNFLGETVTKDLWSNAGQDVLASIETREHQELTLALRSPVSPPAAAISARLLARRQAECVELFWASDANRVLEWSTNLVDWVPLEASAGQGYWLACPDAERLAYYRVSVGP